MKKRSATLGILLLAIAAAIVILVFFEPGRGMRGNGIPAATLQALQHADQYELLSLDPEHSSPEQQRTREDALALYHGWIVLGRTKIDDAPTRNKLNDALSAAAAESRIMPSSCFEPRHGISVTQGDRRVDLVICFHCSQYCVYEGDQQSKYLLVSKSPQPVFDDVLRAAGVTLAERPK